ncbi:MAG: oligosaccharide flippase family protein [Anaerolineae bacterium]|nr:oligosaccharide flippase family protein [Anaerolineae bacterium]MDW8068973.1 oligosaccharide flippase family protein [Anaerolineae bacterium]
MDTEKSRPNHQISVTDQAFRGSAYTIGASLVTLTLGFLRSVLLARFLLPEHFGLVTLALFYIGLAAQLRSLGLDMALIHRQDADEVFRRTYFSLRLGLDLIAFGFLLALAPLLQRAYPHMPGLGAVLTVLVFTYLLANLSQVQETLIRKNLAFSQLAATDVMASVTMTIVAPLLAWRGWGVWALVAEQLSGIGIRFLLTWGPFRQWKPGLGWDRRIVRWFWEYGRPTWAASNLSYLLDRFDDFWIGTALGKVPLGLYSRAYEFAHYPRRVLANPLVTVFLPVFARLQDDRLRLSQAFFRSAYIILRSGFLVAGAFGLGMPEFIRYVIGDQWLPMLWTFRLMLIYTALDPILLLVGGMLLAVGRPQDVRNATVIQTIFFIPAVVLGARLWGINGVALAADGMLLLGAFWLYRPLRQVVDFSFSRLMGWPTVALAIAWGVGFLMEVFVKSTAMGILILKLGVFGWLFGVFLLMVERRDLMAGIRELKGAAWVQRQQEK